MRRSHGRDEMELLDANQPANPMQSLQAYRSPRRRAQWAMALIALIAIASLILVVFRISERNLLVDLSTGNISTNSLRLAQESDQRIASISTVLFVLNLLTVIPFLMWFNRSYRNLLAFGATGLRYGQSPNWAWISFFIPLLNIIRPFQTAQEMWTHTQSTLSSQMPDRDSIVLRWWASYMAMNLLGQITVRAWRDFESFDDIFNANGLSLASDIAVIIASVLAIVFLRRLTERQEMKYQEMTKATAPAESV
ncbi:MAG: DUF4328 domain-containing protein [Anaerolineae bacterium]|nr:DUF4328 domain-containing protein [Anaerolineae bacterium]